jgi:hypothetical protein
LFTQDGAFLVTAAFDQISVWDAATLRKLERASHHSKPPTAIALLPDGQLMSSGLDGELWLRDLGLETRPPDAIRRIEAERSVQSRNTP